MPARPSPWVLIALMFVAAAPETADKFPTGMESADLMTVPPGFSVQLVAGEPDVVNPIGIDFDHRGRIFVLECLEYPRKAPPGQKGRDRVRILEDTDGDGTADKVTVFADGLNLATGIAVGHGGVFVGEAPELVFLEDTDGDDRADKRTVLLEGWGYQDTHETLNSFLWGPDGWLYGCHGVFTHSKVQGIPFSAAIWRYHPQTKEFEVFAEGTSNPWGYDYDENGSSFLTACVIPHLFHMVPGGLYIRQAGQNQNPYAYGQIKEISDHRHYRQGGYRGSVAKSTYGGGHAHAGCLIYQGGAFPPEYEGRVFMGNIHGSRINTDILSRNGSTFVGSHGPDFLLSNDARFRAIQVRTGPDGAIYVIDWYDPQICHNTDPSAWEREHGRVYRIAYQEASQPKVGDLTTRSSRELVELLTHKNSWWWRKALLILDERGDRSVTAKLREMIRTADDYRHRLRALWALSNLEEFDESLAREVLDQPNPWLRAWAVRLLGQLETAPSSETWQRLLALARQDPSPDVRSQLASSCQRWQGQRDVRAMLEALMLRDEDVADPVIPQLIWVAYEPGVVAENKQTLDFLASVAKDHPLAAEAIAPRVVRRLVATGEREHLETAVAFLGRLEGPRALAASVEGLLAALERRRLEPPSTWPAVATRLTRLSDADLARRVRRLGIHFGDAGAVSDAQREATNSQAKVEDRIQAIEQLALARHQGSVEPLLHLATGATDNTLQSEAMRALAGFQGDAIPQAVLIDWGRLSEQTRAEAIRLLSGRRSWALALMQAVADGRVKRSEVSPTDVRRMLALEDEALAALVGRTWGTLRDSTPERVAELIVAARDQLNRLPGDRSAGQAVFEKNCMVCHTLYGKGSEVGPDLTGANRRDPEYLLQNVLDPNSVVGRDYYTAIVVDLSGRVHTGLLLEQTDERVVLKGENAKRIVLPRDEIDAFKVQEKSLMPDGLPEEMSPEQFRDLVAYLLEDPFLDRGLVAGPFKAPLTLQYEFPIETSADPLQTEGVAWRSFHLGPTANLDFAELGALAPAANSGAFVYAEVRSSRTFETFLELSADDSVKVWLNGSEVASLANARRGARVPVEMKEGVNRLLFKVANFYGPSTLQARLVDPQRQLVILMPEVPNPAAGSGH